MNDTVNNGVTVLLVSHTHKFIYLKTRKTAGTSVEAYFDQFCLPPNELSGQHDLVGRQSKYGICSGRNDLARELPIIDPDVQAYDVYNHMTAKELKDELGSDIWNNYYKFCVVRNPWDRAVSMFWFKDSLLRYKLEQDPDLSFEKIAEQFNVYADAKEHWMQPDTQHWSIDGQLVVDDVIHYETLEEDCARISSMFDHTFTELPRFKTNSRKLKLHYREYYTNPEVLEKLTELFMPYSKQFGYTF